MGKIFRIFNLCIAVVISTVAFGQYTNRAVLSGNSGGSPNKGIRLGKTNIETDSVGRFSHTINLHAPSFFNFSLGGKKIEIFLSPGDNLSADFKSQAIIFNGSGAPINNFLQEHEGLAKRNSRFLDTYNKQVFGLEFSNFKQKIDSLKTTEISSFDEFIEKNPKTSSTFIDRLKIDLDYRYRRYYLLYPLNYHRHHGYKEIANVALDYHDRIMQGCSDKPELLSSANYIQCMNKYLDILSVGKYKLQNLQPALGKRINARYDAIINLQADQKIQDYFIGEHFNNHIWIYRVEALDYSYNKYKKDCKDTTIKKRIQNLYQIGIDRRKAAHEITLYRKIGTIELKAHIFYPENFDKNNRYPAHLFFHGGSWALGMPEWSYDACKKAASKGRVSIAFDYRLRHLHSTGIRAAVSDALTAIAWVRENATNFGIDPGKILAEGFSSGGHLALTAAMIKNPKEFGVDSEFSSKPNLLILGSTPYDVTFRDVYDIGYDPKQISPLNLVVDQLPPMLMFHGENDTLVSFKEFQKFIEKMKATDNEFVYRSFQNANHFYSGGSKEDSQIRERMRKKFLAEQGYGNK